MHCEHILRNWPGKSPAAEGQPEHPALYHMIDVGAVAERLARPLDLAPARFDLICFLAALHDLGKLNRGFRAMLRDGARGTTPNHWEMTEVLLWAHFDLVADLVQGSEEALEPLFAAVAGHHGRPSRLDPDQTEQAQNRLSTEELTDSATAIEALFALWPRARLDGMTEDEALRLSWWLPGFIAAADWVGSNTRWFPAVADLMPLDAYGEGARLKAEEAVRAAGLDVPTPSEARLFSFDPRPMQAACQSVDLPEGPMLAILEDETGAGKTEAALILAQRMLNAGKGQGLFFALPTMATANAMFERVSASVHRMFTTPPSLALAHGRAALSGTYSRLIAEPSPGSDAPVCTDWLADDRRRALLASVGVGTIDQALMGVLPTRHATLRLYGLSSKILIVDEVHELGEPYMATELVHLLRAHHAQGGSAILLTATLPLALRQAFLRAYGAEDDGAPAYPALTLSRGAALRDLPQTTSARGPVKVARLARAQEAVQLLATHAAAGAACLWVRNAVDDAIAAVDALKAAGVEADLLHARFALQDRLDHETAALSRFGKARDARPGRVLVATQVVESSLDLDFDVMVSDLAPMAALVQRAGRLWRHMAERPSETRPVPGPVLHVVAPDPASVTDPNWLYRVLDKGAYVYGHDLQWRTAKVLFETGEIVAPAGLRALIEAAHGSDLAVPPALEEAELKRQGEQMAAANQAKRNVVCFEDGYRSAGGGVDDRVYPTRLGMTQQVLVLARWSEGRLVPWAEDAQRSEVQVGAHRLEALDMPDQDAPEIEMLTKEWPKWRRETVLVCRVGEGGRICEGLSYDRHRGVMFE